MIHFASAPTKNALSILHTAMDEAIGFLTTDGTDMFEIICENSQRHFTHTGAVEMLRQLRTASSAEPLYRLTDYHWELLYDVLMYWATWDTSPLDTRRDLIDEMIDEYFWDTDFLLDADTMLDLTHEQKAQMGFSPETFGLTQGLLPSAEELAITLVE